MPVARPLALGLLFGVLMTLAVGAWAEESAPVTGVGPKTALVATRDVPPFAFKGPDGWDGIAIELLRRVAAENGFEIRFQEMGLAEMLDAVIQGKVDAAAAAVTITADRERKMDFTHPFYSAGLGVAAAQQSDVTWLSGVKRVFSGPFIHSMAALLGVLALVGLLVWLAERKRNHQFDRAPVTGIGSGIWWSAVTMTTVGYGDKAPATLAGRIIGLVWMFASVMLISGFTASIASSLTIGQLDQAIRGVDDLRGKRVLTTEGSTSADYLDDKLVRYRKARSIPDALALVASGEADAVVYDAPILSYLINERFPRRLRVLPTVFARQDYGIALPPGSPLREGLNREILQLIKTPQWDAMVEGYLGPAR